MKIEKKTSVELDSILGEEFKILDHGFIRVMDYMGNDESITQAARVSYGAGTKTISDDKALINYLIKHKHTSPLEMCEIKLHLKMPIFVARQWLRHRMASVNEYSARYSDIKDEFYIPEPERVQMQSKSNKQCSGETVDEKMQHDFIRICDKISETAKESYDTFNKHGISRELNRINTPLNNYTEFYWKIDLHNLLHFVRLRDHPHAQYEIRVYAEKILELIKLWCPLACEAFIEYQKEAITFGKTQAQVFKKILKGENVTQEVSGLSKRDWNELQEFLK